MLKLKKKVRLTPEQIEFLVENYDHLEDLVNERVLPANKAGENFIKTINCGLKPSNKWEYAYWYAKQNNISFYRLKEKLDEAIGSKVKKEIINKNSTERKFLNFALKRHFSSCNLINEGKNWPLI